MDYIGSKIKLNNWIFSIIMKNINTTEHIFLDACAGSGAITKYACENINFKKIITNDIMEFPSHIINGLVNFSEIELAKSLINKMNNLNGKKGFFYKNYSEISGRLYFNDNNAKKIDACRIFIENNTKNNSKLKSYLLYCLLESVSSVSNTAGVQAAFLKKLKSRALKDIIIKPLKIIDHKQSIEIYNKDILNLLKNKSFRNKNKETILYIDPPYNQRQYGPNYHLYETLIKYDNPLISGKTGLRDWKNENKSQFCSKLECFLFMKNIIKNTTAAYIYISYSSDGLMNIEDFKLLSNKIDFFELDQKRYKSDSNINKNYNNKQLKEYLIRIEK